MFLSYENGASAKFFCRVLCAVAVGRCRDNQQIGMKTACDDWIQTTTNGYTCDCDTTVGVSAQKNIDKTDLNCDDSDTDQTVIMNFLIKFDGKVNEFSNESNKRRWEVSAVHVDNCTISKANCNDNGRSRRWVWSLEFIQIRDSNCDFDRHLFFLAGPRLSAGKLRRGKTQRWMNRERRARASHLIYISFLRTRILSAPKSPAESFYTVFGEFILIPRPNIAI